MMRATQVWRSVLAKPLTTLYLIASGVIIAGFAGWIEVAMAIVILTFMFIVLLVLGLYRENKLAADKTNNQLEVIHTLVNSQHTDLVERVEQLIHHLQAAGVTVPKAKGSRTQ